MFNKTIKYKKNNKLLIVNESHLHQHPEMNNLMQSVFEKFLEKEQDYLGKIIKLEINMNTIIGKTHCVLTDDKNEVYYAQRKGRNTFTRFIKNKSSQDCDTVTLVVSRGSANTFHLITSYIGYVAQKEPLDPTIKTEKEFLESKDFWKNHALVEGSQSIYKKTITEVCPWDNFNNRPVIQFGDKNNIIEIINKMRKEPCLNNDTINQIKK